MKQLESRTKDQSTNKYRKYISRCLGSGAGEIVKLFQFWLQNFGFVEQLQNGRVCHQLEDNWKKLMHTIFLHHLWLSLHIDRVNSSFLWSQQHPYGNYSNLLMEGDTGSGLLTVFRPWYHGYFKKVYYYGGVIYSSFYKDQNHYIASNSSAFRELWKLENRGLLKFL